MLKIKVTMHRICSKLSQGTSLSQEPYASGDQPPHCLNGFEWIGLEIKVLEIKKNLGDSAF